MEQIHIKVMQEMYDELFEIIGERSDLHHVWLAYVFKDNIIIMVDKEDGMEEFKGKYKDACTNNARMRRMNIKGINLGEAVMDSYMAVQYMEGKRAFEQAISWKMLDEMGEDVQALNLNWVYLAYSYFGTPDFKEKLEEAKWASHYEIMMLASRKWGYEIEDVKFQRLYQDAINAYRFYMNGM
jgi:hypothetical protein